MDTPKYGWTLCDIYMNIDTVLYVDILLLQVARKASLRIFKIYLKNKALFFRHPAL